MTIISSETSAFSWSEVKHQKTFSRKFQENPEGNIQSLTNSLAGEILNNGWCRDHNILCEKHRNSLICRVIREIGKFSVSRDLVSIFFRSLSLPQFQLFPLKYPLFIPEFEQHALYSKSDFHVLLSEEIKQALENNNDFLAKNILSTAKKANGRLLMLAIKHNCFETMETFLKIHEYNQALLDKSLSIACSNQTSETLIILLKTGANPNTLLEKGLSAIHMAARNKNPEILKAIFANSQYEIDVDTLQSLSETPAGIAYEAGLEDNFDLLLSKMSNPNILDANGQALIHHTCSVFSNTTFNPIALPLLIEKYKANVNLPDNYGKTPIQNVLRNIPENLSQTIEILLKNGADITKALYEKQPLISLCIDKNLLVNILPLFKAFPNIVSCLNGGVKNSTAFLLAIKANLSYYLLTDDESANPLDIALMLQDVELAVLICKDLSPAQIEKYYQQTRQRFPGCSTKVLDLAVNKESHLHL